MKELDLTGAKLLKLWLRMGYYEYQISGEKDVCTLVRMCLRSGLCGAGYLVTFTLMLGVLALVVIAVCLMFSFLTLYLPETYYADLATMSIGAILLFIVCVIFLVGFVVEVFQGKRKFAPEYMKRPARELLKGLFKGKECLIQEDKPCVEYQPSQTWIACKEMYTSVKEKTCIKVKL